MKRFSSVFLSIMVLFVAQFSVNPVKIEAVDNDDVTFTKSAERVPGTVNTWDITLEVKGKPSVEPSPADIVLVLDNSQSMRDNNKLVNLKAAAVKFVDQILGAGGNTNSRIAIVTFSTGTSTVSNFTSNATALKNSINNIQSSAYTFLQGGIKVGADHLIGSSSNNKHLVVMTDGDPNVSYRIDYSQARSGYIVTDPGAPGSVQTVWSSDVPENFFNYTGNNNTITGTANGGVYISNGNNGTPRYYNAANSAIAQGRYAKTHNLTLYTIGFAISPGSVASTTLQAIASSGQAYTADNDTISQIYSNIAQEIKSSISAASIKDVMGDGFAIYPDKVSQITASQGTPTYNASTRTLDWNIGNLNTVDATDNAYNSAKLTYRVEITDDILGLGLPLDGMFPTNKSAVFSYLDNDKIARTKSVDSPMVNPTFITVKKELLNSSGVVSVDDHLSFNFGINSSDERYSNNLTLKPNEQKTYTTLRSQGDYTVHEVETGSYTRTVDVNTSKTNASNADFLVGDDGKDISILFTNKENDAGIITATKTVLDANENGFAEKGETLTYTLHIKNTGSAPARNLFIQDTLSEILDHIDDPRDNVVSGISNIKISDLMTGINVYLESGGTLDLSFEVSVKDTLNTDLVKWIANMATIGNTTPEVEIETGAPKLSATKSVLDGNGNGYAEPGETLHYTIEIKNSGKVEAKDVHIQDSLSELLGYVLDPSSGMLGGTWDKTIADLINGFSVNIPVNSTIKLEFDLTLIDTFDVSKTLTLTNIAFVDDLEPTVTIPTGDSNLVASKSVRDHNANDFAEGGETLYYTIEAKNTGNIVLKDLFIQDDLANILGSIENPDNQALEINHAGSLKTMTVKDLMDGLTFTLLPDTSVVLAFSVKVLPEVNTEVLHNVSIVGDERPEASIDTGSVMMTSAKTVLDANGNGFAEPGEKLSYELKAVNTGIVPIKDLLIQDTLSLLLEHIDDPKTRVLTLSNGGVTSTLTVLDLMNGFKIDLIPGATFTAKFDLNVLAVLDTDEVSELKNIAIIGEEIPPVIIRTGSPKLSTTKSVLDDNGNGYAEPGEILTYTLLIENKGKVKAEKVSVSDNLANLLSFIEDPSVNLLSNGFGNVQELMSGILVDVEANGSITISFNVQVKEDIDVNEITELVNVAFVNDFRPTTTIPTGEVKLSSSKAVLDANGNGYAEPNETLHYTISATNSGNLPMPSLWIQDELTDLLGSIKDPKYAVLTLSDGSLLTVNDLMNGFEYTLLANTTLTIEFDVVVNETLEAEILRNIAKVGEERPETEIPTGSVEMTTSKSVKDSNGNEIAEPGEVLSYELKAVNTGVVPVVDLLIQDTLEYLLDHIDNPISSFVTLTNGTDVTTIRVSELMSGFKVNIAPGDTFTAEFEVVVKAALDTDEVTELKNIAIIGEEIPPVIIRSGSPKLVATKHVVDENGNGYAEPGEALTYTILIENKGKVDAKDVRVQDELAGILDALDDVTLNEVYIVENETLRNVSLDDLMKGMTLNVLANGSVSLEFYVRVKENLDVDVTKTLLNKALVNDLTPEVEIETAKPKYSAVKTVVDANRNRLAEQGETLSYTLEITNDGVVDVMNLFVQDEMLLIKEYFVNVDDAVLTLNGDDSFTVKDLIGGFELNLLVGETIHISFDLVLRNDLDMEAIYLIKNIAKVNELNPSASIRTLVPVIRTIDKPDPKPPVTPPVVVKPVVDPVEVPSLPKTGVSPDHNFLPLALIALGYIIRRRAARR